MASRSHPVRKAGSAAASLLAAYAVVFQIVALSLAGLGAAMGSGALGAEALCSSKGEKRTANNPANPSPSHSASHACCVAHGAGADALPPSVDAEALVRVGHLASSLFEAESALALWPTLPVGSRAPPAFFA